MAHIIVIGAGISGVTSAYALIELGHQVTVLDRNLYPAMETSFANGGQLSACNAEVWNSTSTIAKGVRWMLSKDAPLLLNPTPTFHKYSWLAEFTGAIRNYRENTLTTVRLALESRKHLFRIAEAENIEFDLEERGILHFYHDSKSYAVASKANNLLVEGGLERYPVTNAEINKIEPSLRGEYFGGFYTPSDSTGDIHKFTRGLANACERRSVKFVHGVSVTAIKTRDRAEVYYQQEGQNGTVDYLHGDAIVVCAGVGSRALARMAGDRLNIYPVKGYSITVHLDDADSIKGAPWVSLLDESAKIVTSRLGRDRFRVAGTAEFNGYNRDIRADRIEPLVDWTRKNFEINTSRVTPWAGLRPMMPDMLPQVRQGKNPRVFYNTGHGHLGWTLSAATAPKLTGLVEHSLIKNNS
ncbi:D-amino acid dehydrogenase [Rhizobium sp. CG5]|uniref:D-amino acid dehydrogenase n=1 Tax=Rhizobium sp. CG5 TaxID=2726076 RepID=UPI0020349AC2|nr:D-amino acid dehydrogenase [Rhizobium sp. CG5]MCM2476135.1 D-amino acid dehydrogenase [Rhizobium sp. CG5]